MSTESARQTLEINRLQCSHMFPNGHRCGSPALNSDYFCYHHSDLHRRPKSSRPAPSPALELPLPRDRASLLISIGHVLQGIANKTIDRKDAGLLLYGLQVANSSLPREPRTAPTSGSSSTRTRRSTLAPSALKELEVLAPVAEAASSEVSAIPAPPAELREPAETGELTSVTHQSFDTFDSHEGRPAWPTREDEIREAVNATRYEATMEALSEIDEIIARNRAQASAETEARLRAEFNLPQPGTLPTVESAAAPDPADSNTATLETAAPEISGEPQLRVPQISPLRLGSPATHTARPRHKFHSPALAATHSPLTLHSARRAHRTAPLLTALRPRQHRLRSVQATGHAAPRRECNLLRDIGGS